jgi:hypothetical protein
MKVDITRFHQQGQDNLSAKDSDDIRDGLLPTPLCWAGTEIVRSQGYWTASMVGISQQIIC